MWYSLFSGLKRDGSVLRIWSPWSNLRKGSWLDLQISQTARFWQSREEMVDEERDQASCRREIHSSTWEVFFFSSITYFWQTDLHATSYITFKLKFKHERKIPCPHPSHPSLIGMLTRRDLENVYTHCIFHNNLIKVFLRLGLSFTTWIWRIVRVDAVCVIERVKTTETYKKNIWR